MRDLAVLLLHLLATIARLAGPGGARSVVAESVLVKHQLRASWLFTIGNSPPTRGISHIQWIVPRFGIEGSEVQVFSWRGCSAVRDASRSRPDAYLCNKLAISV